MKSEKELAKIRKDSIELLDKETRRLRKIKAHTPISHISEYKYSLYNGKTTGYFYHLIDNRYTKILKEKGLQPRKMYNIYEYIKFALTIEKIKMEIPKHLEAFFVGDTIKDAEIGRNTDINKNDIICRFKRNIVKGYIYNDGESREDKSYLILIQVPPSQIEVKTNIKNNWIPLKDLDDIEDRFTLYRKKHQKINIKGD
jgi:hypothetical protein